MLRKLTTCVQTTSILCALVLAQMAWSGELKPLKFTADQQQTTAEIVAKLHSDHYRDQPINNALSEKFLKNYLKTLDPSKSYFLQSDLDAFNKHKDSFDEDFKKGELTESFHIYDVFRQRFTDRLTQVVAQLKDDKHAYDFTIDESLTIDRDKSQWPANKKAADALWRKRIKSDILSLKLSGKTVKQSRKTLIKRYSAQIRRMSQQTSEDAFSAVINAFTMLYDPHTNYLSPRTLANFNISMSLSLEGIGAMLQSEDEYTKIVRLIPAGPADKQGGLKPADRIIGVGQGKKGEMVDVVGWRLDEVVDLIRGKKGTIVRLEVLPGKAPAGAASHTVSIKRDKVKLEEQSAQKAEFTLSENGKDYKLGVIKVPTFYMDFAAYRKRDPNYKSTTRDVYKLLQKLMADKVDGIVIDLRNNGGGSLHEAATLTDLFIDQGPVVQIRQTDQLISRNYRSHSKAVYRGPIVVLVNRLSASASEIFTGAIQDYGRGVIVGSRTFGKGTVQSLQPLKEGQLKITESKFYRVSGESTQHRGVVPDIKLPKLIDPKEVGESSYDYPLPWDTIHAVKHSHYYAIGKLLPSLEKTHKARVSKDPDFIFLTAEQALINKNAERKSISLNEKTRVKEKDQRESQLLALENQRRKTKGLKPYASYADIDSDDGDGIDSDKTHDAEQQAEDAEPKKIDPQNDPYLTEAGYVLLDFIHDLKKDKAAKIAQF